MLKRTISCDNVVRMWWKRMKWWLKWHSWYWWKHKFSQKFCKMTAKTAFFEINLNAHDTKGEHADENLNHISFFIRDVVVAAWCKYKAYRNTNKQLAYIICYEALDYLLQPKTKAIYAALWSLTDIRAILLYYFLPIVMNAIYFLYNEICARIAFVIVAQWF